MPYLKYHQITQKILKQETIKQEQSDGAAEYINCTSGER